MDSYDTKNLRINDEQNYDWRVVSQGATNSCKS